MTKLTLEKIEQWEKDNSGDFINDGPISIKSWKLINDKLVTKLKKHPILGKFMNPNIQDFTTLVFEPRVLVIGSEEYWLIKDLDIIIKELFCSTAFEVGADIFKDIENYVYVKPEPKCIKYCFIKNSVVDSFED